MIAAILITAVSLWGLKGMYHVIENQQAVKISLTPKEHLSLLNAHRKVKAKPLQHKIKVFEKGEYRTKVY